MGRIGKRGCFNGMGVDFLLVCRRKAMVGELRMGIGLMVVEMYSDVFPGF